MLCMLGFDDVVITVIVVVLLCFCHNYPHIFLSFLFTVLFVFYCFFFFLSFFFIWGGGGGVFHCSRLKHDDPNAWLYNEKGRIFFNETSTIIISFYQNISSSLCRVRISACLIVLYRSVLLHF